MIDSDRRLPVHLFFTDTLPFGTGYVSPDKILSDHDHAGWLLADHNPGSACSTVGVDYLLSVDLIA